MHCFFLSEKQAKKPQNPPILLLGNNTDNKNNNGNYVSMYDSCECFQITIDP